MSASFTRAGAAQPQPRRAFVRLLQHTGVNIRVNVWRRPGLIANNARKRAGATSARRGCFSHHLGDVAGVCRSACERCLFAAIRVRLGGSHTPAATPLLAASFCSDPSCAVAADAGYSTRLNVLASGTGARIVTSHYDVTCLIGFQVPASQIQPR